MLRPMSSRFGTSPLLRPELRRNLCFPSGGGLAVHLSRQWKPMLAGLRRLGPLLLASRNQAAILGHYGCYPEIETDHADRFATPDGDHFFELLRWCHARVWEQPQPDGVGYSVEFRNLEGNLFHKICLTPESDFAGFLDWVEEHQAIGIEGFSMLAPAPSEASQAARAAAASGYGEGKPVEMTELFLAFRHLMHAGLSVSVTLGDGETGMSHSHALPFMRVGLTEGWSYCTDGYESAEGGAVFHLRLDAVDALVVEPRWWEPGAPLQVRGFGKGGEPFFRLPPGKRKQTGEWNRLVRASFGLAD